MEKILQKKIFYAENVSYVRKNNMNIQIIFYRTLSSQSAASLTCGYLATSLRKLGHNVKLLLLDPYHNNLKENDLKKVKYIFYKINFKDVEFIENNIKIIRKQNPKIKIILLGPYTFFWRDKLLKEYDIDAILLPNVEGNITLDLRRMIYLTKHRPEIHKRYQFPQWYHLSIPARDIEKKEPLKIINIEASRGCYNQCSFCHISQICKHFKTKIFRKSVEDVITEIKQLIFMGKRYFIFNDSILWGKSVISGSEVEKFCNEVSNLNNVYFMAYLSLNMLSEKAISILAKGHFIRVFVGLETTDSESLKLYHKNVKVNEYRKLKTLLLRNHIVPHIGFILYHPYTSMEEIRTNIYFLNHLDELHRFGVVYEKMRVFPNTDLYEKLKKDNLLIEKSNHDINYKFKNESVQRFYQYFTNNISKIGLPIFERIEYIFVCSEFIDNLVDLKEQKNEEYTTLYERLLKLRRDYSKFFINFFELCLDNKLLLINMKSEIQNFYSKLESLWEKYIEITKKVGFKNPLEWIANGNYEPEQKVSSKYFIRTRSGSIRRKY